MMEGPSGAPHQVAVASTTDGGSPSLPGCSGAERQGCHGSACGSIQSFEVRSDYPPTHGGGRNTSQTLPSNEVPITQSTHQTLQVRSRPFQSNGGDDGSEDDSRKPLKHSHDESDDASETCEQRKRRRQTNKGSGPGKADECSKCTIDDEGTQLGSASQSEEELRYIAEALEEYLSGDEGALPDVPTVSSSNDIELGGPSEHDSSPVNDDITSAAIPDYLLDNEAFRKPPRWTNRPRSSTVTTGSHLDFEAQVVHRRGSMCRRCPQIISPTEITQLDGAADDDTVADENFIPIITVSSPPACVSNFGAIWKKPVPDPLGCDTAGQGPSPAVESFPRTYHPVPIAQTDGPADDSSLADEQQVASGERKWSWTKGDDKMPLPTYTGAESLGPEERSGNAPGKVDAVETISLPIRARSAAVSHGSPNFSAESSSAPTPRVSNPHSDVSRNHTSSTEVSSGNGPVSLSLIPPTPRNSADNESACVGEIPLALWDTNSATKAPESDLVNPTLPASEIHSIPVAGPWTPASGADNIPLVTWAEFASDGENPQAVGNADLATRAPESDEAEVTQPAIESTSIPAGVSWAPVSGGPDIPLVTMDGGAGTAEDVERGRQESASSTSTCGYCGCGIMNALACISCHWFQRRDSRPQGPQSGPNHFSEETHVAQVPTGESPVAHEGAQGPASEHQDSPTPSELAGPHAGAGGAYMERVDRWNPDFSFGTVLPVEEQGPLEEQDPLEEQAPTEMQEATDSGPSGETGTGAKRRRKGKHPPWIRYQDR